MAIFKDKTGRGEVNYSSIVRSKDGTQFYMDSRKLSSDSLPTSGLQSFQAFQIRGLGFDSAEDVSISGNAVTATNISSGLQKVERSKIFQAMGFNGSNSKITIVPERPEDVLDLTYESIDINSAKN